MRPVAVFPPEKAVRVIDHPETPLRRDTVSRSISLFSKN
jgi:hypothetical protein